MRGAVLEGFGLILIAGDLYMRRDVAQLGVCNALTD